MVSGFTILGARLDVRQNSYSARITLARHTTLDSELLIPLSNKSAPQLVCRGSMLGRIRESGKILLDIAHFKQEEIRRECELYKVSTRNS